MSFETIHVVAGILIRDDLFFVAKRNPGGAAGEKWEFPGGKVEIGETPAVALARELKEELGVNLNVGDPLGIFETQVGDKVIALDCYWIKFEGGTMRLTSHSESRWVAAHELHLLDFAAPDIPVVQAIKQAI